jgi:hypothetical protein
VLIYFSALTKMMDMINKGIRAGEVVTGAVRALWDIFIQNRFVWIYEGTTHQSGYLPAGRAINDESGSGAGDYTKWQVQDVNSSQLIIPVLLNFNIGSHTAIKSIYVIFWNLVCEFHNVTGSPNVHGDVANLFSNMGTKILLRDSFPHPIALVANLALIYDAWAIKQQGPGAEYVPSQYFYAKDFGYNFNGPLDYMLNEGQTILPPADQLAVNKFMDASYGIQASDSRVIYSEDTLLGSHKQRKIDYSYPPGKGTLGIELGDGLFVRIAISNGIISPDSALNQKPEYNNIKYALAAFHMQFSYQDWLSTSGEPPIALELDSAGDMVGSKNPLSVPISDMYKRRSGNSV